MVQYQYIIMDSLQIDHVQMAMLIEAGAVPGLEQVEDLLTSTTYIAPGQSTNLQTVLIRMIQMSMTTMVKIGVSLVLMVNIWQQYCRFHRYKI